MSAGNVTVVEIIKRDVYRTLEKKEKNGNWAHFTEASVEEPFNGKSLFVFLGDAKKVQLFFSREAFRKGEPESSEVLYLRGDAEFEMWHKGKAN